jgi:glycosyltransferase involved in cell wall biosynthesis
MKMPNPESAAPKVSVLMPVYNSAAFLDDAIKSILNQTFADFELLVRDDESADESCAILQRYAAQDRRIRILAPGHLGIAGSRNVLARAARGVYLANMDSDDICLPRRLEKQVAFLDAHPDHVGLGSWFEQVNSKGQPIRFMSLPTSHEEIDAHHLEGVVSMHNPTTMMRRDAALAIDLFSTEYKFADDFDLWLRLGEIGKLANIPEVLLKYRLHNRSVSERHQAQQIAEAKLISERACARRGVTRAFKGGQWRASADRKSRHDYALDYGWIAWGNGYRQTWWTQALEALRLRPFSIASWKLFLLGLIKRPRKAPSDEWL